MSLSAITTYVPLDVLIIAIAIVLLALIALRAGTSLLSSLALSLPFSFVLYEAVFDARWLMGIFERFGSTQLMQVIVFGLLLVVSYVALRRLLGSGYEEGSGILQSFVVAAAAVFITIALWSTIPGTEFVWTFGETVQWLFAPQYTFWWLFGSLIAIGAMQRRW